MFFDWISRRVEQAVYVGLNAAAERIDSGDMPDAFRHLGMRITKQASEVEANRQNADGNRQNAEANRQNADGNRQNAEANRQNAVLAIEEAATPAPAPAKKRRQAE